MGLEERTFMSAICIGVLIFRAFRQRDSLQLGETVLQAYNVYRENGTAEVKRMHQMSFKKCSKCGFIWYQRAAFLSDPNLRMIGYQAYFDEPLTGLFLFNHTCGTSLAIKAGDFQDLFDGPMYTERLNGTEKCGGHCLHKSDLSPCPQECECSYVREIVQVILKWPKQEISVKQ